jgi:hypothetical protein
MRTSTYQNTPEIDLCLAAFGKFIIYSICKLQGFSGLNSIK